jgi:hypothetical protein
MEFMWAHPDDRACAIKESTDSASKRRQRLYVTILSVKMFDMLTKFPIAVDFKVNLVPCRDFNLCANNNRGDEPSRQGRKFGTWESRQRVPAYPVVTTQQEVSDIGEG